MLAIKFWCELKYHKTEEFTIGTSFALNLSTVFSLGCCRSAPCTYSKYALWHWCIGHSKCAENGMIGDCKFLSIAAFDSLTVGRSTAK